MRQDQEGESPRCRMDDDGMIGRRTDGPLVVLLLLLMVLVEDDRSCGGAHATGPSSPRASRNTTCPLRHEAYQ